MAEERDSLVQGEEQADGLTERQLDKRVVELLKQIEEKPKGTVHGSVETKSGWIYKKKQKSDSWNRYFARVNEKGSLSYYKNEGASRANGVLNVITYATARRALEEDKLANEQHKRNETVCSMRIHVFSTRRHYLFSADDDEEAKSWLKSLESAMRYNFNEEEISHKRESANEIFPLIEEQMRIQLERFLYLRSVLAQTSFMDDGTSTKLKEGYLKLQILDAEGTWRKLYVVINKKYIHLYRLEDKSIPVGLIALRFIVLVEPTTSVHKSNRKFIVQTPLRKYLFKAKHDIAMVEWINSIREAISKRDPNHTAPVLLELPKETNEAPIIDSKIQLVANINGKQKNFTLNKPVNTLGRASNNDVKLVDTKVSRNHAKIEIHPGSAPIFYDLGSSRGSKVNNERVNRIALRIGDKIKIGNIILTVEAKR